MPLWRPQAIFHHMTQTEIRSTQISLTVNGQSKILPRGSTIAGLLADLELHPRTVVVEHNRVILKDRELFATIELGAGDNIEIVHFVGGG